MRKAGTAVITPKPDPDPLSDEGWCFPDTEEGILKAVSREATHLWANTILFASHPLPVSDKLAAYASTLKVVGQPPQLVEQYDDKNFVNNLLRKDGSFTLPNGWLVHSLQDKICDNPPLPIVAKPIRGRGSYGVKLCRSKEQLTAHLKELLAESSPAMLEEYLPGQEGTITVMPPSKHNSKFTALPVVVRFNHQDGVAPYNGVVAVTANSRIPSKGEREAASAYAKIERACERVAEKLKVTAPIRIDVRQVTENPRSDFAIFDVNMKPNMTGPGRPGRENQASLTALAAAEVGWDYPRLLQEVLNSAQSLEVARARSID